MAKEPTKGQKALMKKLKASQAEGMGARARKKISKDSGTLTSRMESAKKSAKQKGGLPAVRKETLPAVRKENLPAKKDGGSRAVVKRGSGQMVVRDGKGNLPARAGGGASSAGGGAGGIGKLARGLGSRAALTAGFLLDPSTFSAKTGGQANYGEKEWLKGDRGPLMKGGKQPGYKYRDDGAIEKRKEVRQASPGLSPDPEFIKQQIAKKKASAGEGVDKPRVKAPIPKPRPDMAKPVEVRKTFAKKDAPKAAPKPSFRANWVGAAPTEMQARGGARIKRRSLRDLIRGER